MSATDTTGYATTERGHLCPIDGGPMKSEMLAEFYECATCNEVLYPRELVHEFTRDTQTLYLARVHPEGYDRPIPKTPGRITRLVKSWFIKR